MTGKITRRRATVLGISMGQRHSAAAIGYALYARRPGPPIEVTHGPVLEQLRKALRANPQTPLYVYLTDEAYQGSRGWLDGLTRDQHEDMVITLARTLATEGFDLTILEVE